MFALIKKIISWIDDNDYIVIVVPALWLAIKLMIWKLWFVVGMFLSIGAVVGLWEWLAIKYTALSISDQIRYWRQKNPVQGKAFIYILGILLFTLIFHFSLVPIP